MRKLIIFLQNHLRKYFVVCNYKDMTFQTTIWNKVFCSKEEQYQRWLDSEEIRTNPSSIYSLRFIKRNRNKSKTCGYSKEVFKYNPTIPKWQDGNNPTNPPW